VAPQHPSNFHSGVLDADRRLLDRVELLSADNEQLRSHNELLQQRLQDSEALMQVLREEVGSLRQALWLLEKSVAQNAQRGRGHPAIAPYSAMAAPTQAAAATNSTLDAAVQAAQQAAAEEVVKLCKSLQPQAQAPVGCPVAMLPTAMPAPIMGYGFHTPLPVPAAQPNSTCEPRFQQDMLDMLQRIERDMQANSCRCRRQPLPQSQLAYTAEAPAAQAPLVTINASGLDIPRSRDVVEQREGTAFQAPQGRSVSYVGGAPGHGSIRSPGGRGEFSTLLDQISVVNKRIGSQPQPVRSIAVA
jgi:hypothetical protein